MKKLKGVPEIPVHIKHLSLVPIAGILGDAGMVLAVTKKVKQGSLVQYTMGVPITSSSVLAEGEAVAKPVNIFTLRMSFVRAGATYNIRMDTATFARILRGDEAFSPMVRVYMGAVSSRDYPKVKEIEATGGYNYGQGSMSVLIANLVAYGLFSPKLHALTNDQPKPEFSVDMDKRILYVQIGTSRKAKLWEFSKPLPGVLKPLDRILVGILSGLGVPENILLASGVVPCKDLVDKAIYPPKISWPMPRQAKDNQNYIVGFMPSLGAVVYGDAADILTAVQMSREAEIVPNDNSGAWLSADWWAGTACSSTGFVKYKNIGFLQGLLTAPLANSNSGAFQTLFPALKEKGIFAMSLNASQMVALPRMLQATMSPVGYSVGNLLLQYNIGARIVQMTLNGIHLFGVLRPATIFALQDQDPVKVLGTQIMQAAGVPPEITVLAQPQVETMEVVSGDAA